MSDSDLYKGNCIPLQTELVILHLPIPAIDKWEDGC